MLKPLPLEASILPVSDKPVTLSFNKVGLSLNKPKTESIGMFSAVMILSTIPTSAEGKLAAAAGLALDDEEDDDEEADPQVKAGVDAKGLFYLRFADRCLWNCMLTMRDAQWLPQEKLRR
jgi:hypothetical protein